MQRIATSSAIGDGKTRWRVRIESDECDPKTPQLEQVKSMLLENIVQNPFLVACGLLPFQTLKMHHNGVRWIIEAEAISEPSNEQQTQRNPS